MPSRQLPILKKWQTELQNAITDWAELLQALDLTWKDFPDAQQSIMQKASFPLKVPKNFVQRMRRKDPHCPLLLQVLPRVIEEAPPEAGYCLDPLQEQTSSTHQGFGLLHKFPQRVLLTTTGHCAVHCRYCFRRHYPYAEQTPSLKTIQESLAYVRQRPEITEFIFSGGDPLSLKDQHLRHYFEGIASIEHIQGIRLHSRFPVVIPSRIDHDFLQLLKDAGKPITLVLHINHPQEIHDELIDACHQLHAQGIILLNQSVMLKDINDDVATLEALSYALRRARILPYYIHALDPVVGAQHFAVSDASIKHIQNALACRLPGYLLPRFVREVPGEPHKIPL